MDLENKIPVRFWIPVSDWIIGDILSSEVLSPSSFYPLRRFGVSSLAFPDHNGYKLHDQNSITLFDEPYTFLPSENKPVYFLIKASSLDERKLIKVNEKVSIYTTSIYLRRGTFQVRFFSEADLKLFLVREKMSREAKTLEKYTHSFSVGGNNHVHLSINN